MPNVTHQPDWEKERAMVPNAHLAAMAFHDRRVIGGATLAPDWHERGAGGRRARRGTCGIMSVGSWVDPKVLMRASLPSSKVRMA